MADKLTRLIGITVLALGLSGGLSPGDAQAQGVCGARADVVSNLEKAYKEAPVSMGLGSNGMVIEVFASEGGSFTIVMTRPDGMSCLMAAGEGWENVPTVKTGAKI